MKNIESIEVGDIFAESYGCNANQTAFYQVVKRTAKFVDVRRIRATAGKTLDGMDYELIPTADDFMDAEPTRFKIKNWTSKSGKLHALHHDRLYARIPHRLTEKREKPTRKEKKSPRLLYTSGGAKCYSPILVTI